jgi:hypothetical protein
MLETEKLARFIELLAGTRELYLFADDQDRIVDSDWFDNDQEALAYAKTLDRRTIYILKPIGISSHDRQEYEIYDVEVRP